MKMQIFELMSGLCLYSEEGYHLALEALADYKVRSHRKGFTAPPGWHDPLALNLDEAMKLLNLSKVVGQSDLIMVASRLFLLNTAKSTACSQLEKWVWSFVEVDQHA